jgi:hypothetical protein
MVTVTEEVKEERGNHAKAYPPPPPPPPIYWQVV